MADVKNLAGLGGVEDIAASDWEQELAHRKSAIAGMRYEMQEEIRNLEARLDKLESVSITNMIGMIEQLQGQVRQQEAKIAQHEAALVEYRGCILEMREHIQMLGNAQARGDRRAMAAHLAVQAKGPGDPQERTRAHAEEWYQFLTKDNPPPVTPNQQHIGNSVDEDPSTPPTTLTTH
jgi:hypothetical protein